MLLSIPSAHSSSEWGMAVMKGILDVVTILPDSIGWKQQLDNAMEDDTFRNCDHLDWGPWLYASVHAQLVPSTCAEAFMVSIFRAHWPGMATNVSGCTDLHRQAQIHIILHLVGWFGCLPYSPQVDFSSLITFLPSSPTPVYSWISTVISTSTSASATKERRGVLLCHKYCNALSVSTWEGLQTLEDTQYVNMMIWCEMHTLAANFFQLLLKYELL